MMAQGAKPTQATDHELMAAVARGDVASMSGIYEHRNRALFRFFFRLTGRQAPAEDLTHEVFLRMIRYRHTYQAGDGFEAWMYRIARNAFADYVRKNRFETPAVEGEMEAVESGHPSQFESVAKQQDLATLHRALGRLPDEKRELILLSRFQGLSYEQIGRIVGCETGTVKVRVFRAMKEMGRIYGDLLREKAS
jgi:RNA polymerase sigma-70 factor (ECF subfamily)